MHVSGRMVEIDGQRHLVLTRQFTAPATEVWRALTESDRLEAWIGRWEGDPASGQVTFFMTAEGDDPEPEPEEYTILECDPPRRFAGNTAQAGGAWHLWFELADDGGDTALTFGQRLNPGEDVGSIGPGWEYYLDRLVAVMAGRDAATVAWDDYYPALKGGYEALGA